MSAYFLGGYGEDGRGVNGLSQAVIAAAKSWFVGIPVSLLTLCRTFLRYSIVLVILQKFVVRNQRKMRIYQKNVILLVKSQSAIETIDIVILGDGFCLLSCSGFCIM